VIAYDVAAAQRHHAYFLWTACTWMAAAAVHRVRAPVDRATARSRIEQAERGATRRIHLVAMVHLDDLQIVLCQQRARLLSQVVEHRHAQAVVGRGDQRDHARRLVEPLPLRRAQPSGAEHERPLETQHGTEQRVEGRRQAEVDHDVGTCDRLDMRRERPAERAHAR
jgi:hypothetical protein